MDAWSYLPGTGDAYERMPGTSGDAWERLAGSVGDAWKRLRIELIDLSGKVVKLVFTFRKRKISFD